MKFLSAFASISLFAASAVVASASTINLASYGSATGTAVPSGVGNTALLYKGGSNTVVNGTTYDVSTGGIWTAPTGNSSWVAMSPNDEPGGGNVEPNGTYIYTTTFADASPLSSTGTLTVMADDTAAVYLNGHLVTAAASSATNGRCDSSTPNCTVPAVYTLTSNEFVSGTNTLSFYVLQQHGSAEGVDFSGSVTTSSVTPEPGSLLLMGTGLAMLAGFTFSRRVEA